jgi:16S rRNA (guanine527-N7)-methyltransferase
MFDVSRETAARLDRFVDLLLNWQRRTNLIAPSTVPSLWTRHVADSLQLLALVGAPQARPRVWLDLGSGGGFPGIVIACAIAEVPGAQIHLVESNLKKAAFLREAVRQTNTPGVVHAVRIESAGSALGATTVDYVTARAVAPLPDLLEMTAPLDHELTESTKRWHIEAETVVSRTNKAGRILIVHALSKRINLSPAMSDGQGGGSQAARNRKGVD